MNQIVWGDGRVKMEAFTDKADGSFGLCLSDSGEGHKPGEVFQGEPEKDHIQKEGEFYLRFKNKDGLRALIFSLIDLVMEDEAR